MLKPYRSVMRIGGMLTPEQQAQIQEAQAQLAEMEQQMASMPPEQRDMMMRMAGPQLETIRSMAASGGFEIKTEILNVTCNAGLPDPNMMTRRMMGDAAGGSPNRD